MKVQLIVRHYANCIIVCLKYAVDCQSMQQIFYQIVFPLIQLNVNTYANSVIERSFTLMKFMEVLMNVYLRYSFNC